MPLSCFVFRKNLAKATRRIIVNPVCSRHSEKPAHWLCPKCKQPFCSDCVITLDASSIGGTQVVRFCRKCMIATKPIGVTDAIIPFWKRIFSEHRTSPSYEKSQKYTGKPDAVVDDPATLTLKKVDALCGENKRDKAIDHIRQWMKNGGKMNAVLAGRYSDLLIKTEQTDELGKHAPLFIKLLIAAREEQMAITIFDACGEMAHSPTMAAATLLKIGDILSANGRARDAIKVFSMLAKQNPEAPETPLAYFKAAQTCHERLMAPDRAKKILKQLIQKYPTHTMAPAFKSYLDRIGK
jgi:tetratricopeptide (TPR) repeat protein